MERLARNYTMLTDDYEYSMSDVYQNSKKDNEEAVFDLFFRKVPSNGGYAVMAGIDKVIEFIKNLHYSEEDLEYFRKAGYAEDFIEYLRNFKFTGDIYAIPDGTAVFPNEPLITVKAPLIEAQVIETALLCMINGAMEHATGARRIIEAKPEGVKVMEFGARRADGNEAAIDSSIYGIMAGCDATSNVFAANMMGIKAIGTMAHSFIESFDTELEAFITYANRHPDNCTLLVDTYDTLKSGVPNAIKTFEYMRDNNMSTDHLGIRIDSGDLAYLSKEARRMLDEAGFPQAKICLSNGLNATTIKSLVHEGAKFDSLGVGDNISKPDGRMGCVYKEVAITKDGELIPKIKLSNDTIKIVNPGFKKLYRLYDKKTGYAICDVMCNQEEELKDNDLVIVSLIDFMKSTKVSDYTIRPLQETIFKDGKLVYEEPSLYEKRDYCMREMATIYPEVKRELNPHLYYVDGTEEYATFKKGMIDHHRTLVRKL